MSVRRIWTRYLEVLNRRPLATQMLQTGMLMGTGDAIAQKLIENNPGYDVARTVRFVGIGTVFVVSKALFLLLLCSSVFCITTTLSYTLAP